MRRRRQLRFLKNSRFLRRPTFFCAFLAACAIIQSDWRLEPSPIGTDRATLPAVQIPDTVTAGVPDTVVVWTKGGGCTRRAAAQVASDDLVVTVRLFDSILVRMRENEACPAVAWVARRPVVIRFSQPGVGTIRVVGKDTLVERRIFVRWGKHRGSLPRASTEPASGIGFSQVNAYAIRLPDSCAIIYGTRQVVLGC